MLKPLKIYEKSYLPAIELDKEGGIFKIKGKSIPEDSANFYSIVFKWFDEYFKDPNEHTRLIFNLDYYNSSSAREVANLIKYFDSKYQEGFDVSIVWLYNGDDEVMKENGEDFSILFSIPIEIKEI
jgi:hypothetical protein